MDCTGQNQGRQDRGNTSSNPQVSTLISRPAFNRMERGCQRHGRYQNSHSPVLVRKPLCNQFIYYHINCRGVYGINHFKLRNFAVVAIECSFATVDRGSIMARIHRWSVTIYDSLQAEFMLKAVTRRRLLQIDNVCLNGISWSNKSHFTVFLLTSILDTT